MQSLKLVLESLGFSRFASTPAGTCARIGLLDEHAAWVHTPNDSFAISVSSILTPGSFVQFHKRLETLKLPNPGIHTVFSNPIGTVLFWFLRLILPHQYERQRAMSEFQIALAEYPPNPLYTEFPYEQSLLVEKIFQTSTRLKDSGGRDWILPLHVLAYVKYVFVQPAANAQLLLET